MGATAFPTLYIVDFLSCMVVTSNGSFREPLSVRTPLFETARRGRIIVLELQASLPLPQPEKSMEIYKGESCRI